MKKCIYTLFTGIVVGMAIGVAIYPEMDRNTRKKIKKAKRRVIDTACDSYDSMINMI